MATKIRPSRGRGRGRGRILGDLFPRSGGVHRPLPPEWLEERLAPASGMVALADLLEFSGSYVQESATSYTFTGTPTQPIEIGPAVPLGGTFTPLMQVDNGTIMFDTSDTEGHFTVSGEIDAQVQVPDGPGMLTVPLLTGTNTLTAEQVTNSGFTTASPLSFKGGLGMLEIDNVRLTTDPDSNAPALAINGSLTIKLPVVTDNQSGGGGAGAPMASQSAIMASLQGSDALYLTTDSVDVSGISFSVTGSFAFAGVTFQATGLTVDATSTLGDFSIYGSVSVMTASPDSATPSPSADPAADPDDSAFMIELDGTLGTSADPGFVFTDWVPTAINTTLNGGFNFGGLKAQATNLNLSYTNSVSGYDSATEIGISGGLSLTLGSATLSAFLGSPTAGSTTPGVEINSLTGVKFNALTLSVSDFDLGVFTIDTLSLSFTNETDESGYTGPAYMLGVTADISLPGNWAVDGSFVLTFADGGFQVDDVALSIAGAVPLGDTDVYVVYIAADLQNIGTQNWSVSGTLGLAFGQTIPDTNDRIAEAVGNVTFNKDELTLTGQVGIVASFDTTTNALTSTVGLVDGGATIDWADDDFEVSLSGSFFDSTITFGGTFQYDDGNFVLSAMASLNVPAGIPLIGGDSLGSANLLFEYGTFDGQEVGFIAGWVHIFLVGNVGIEYNLLTGGKPFLIGNSAIAALGQIQVGSTNSNQVTYYTYTQTFDAPDGSDPNEPAGAESLAVSAQWFDPNPGATSFLTLSTAGSSVADNGGQISGGTGIFAADVSALTTISPPAGQSFLGMNYSQELQTLPAGQYTITLYSTNQLDPNAIVWSALPGYSTPQVDSTVGSVAPLQFSESGTNLDFTQVIDVDPAFASQTTVKLFMVSGSNSGFNTSAPPTGGVQIGEDDAITPYGLQADIYNVAFTVNLATLDPPPGTYYFYTIIDDGQNNPVVTAYSTQPPLVTAPPIIGTVAEVGDGRDRLLTGWTVRLYGQKNAINGTRPYIQATTDASGEYSFYDDPDTGGPLTVGKSYTVSVIPPQNGFLTTQAAAGVESSTFTYGGSQTTENLAVSQLSTISGTIFGDTNGDGVQDDGETGVAGATVYLDLNDNGKLDPGEPMTSTLSDGSYEFLDVPGLQGVNGAPLVVVRYILPTNDLPGKITAEPVAIASFQADPLALISGNNFAVVPAATIGGTVTGSPISAGQLGTDAPQAGWTIELKNSGGATVATATTNATGQYAFTSLVAGSYTVQEVPPPGWQQVAPYTTTPGLQSALLPIGNQPASVVVGDFNNDGYLDIAFIDQGNYSIGLVYGNASGTFSSGNKSSLFNTGLTPSAVEMVSGNFNNDAYLDLLILGSDGLVRLVTGGPTGFTGYSVVSSAPGGLKGIVATSVFFGIAAGGDFNQDGIDDFVVYGLETLEIEGTYSSYDFADIYESNASAGGFVGTTPFEHMFIPSPNGVYAHQFPGLSDHAVAIGDLNNDGIADIFFNFGSGGYDFGSMSGYLGPAADWIAYGSEGGFVGEQVAIYSQDLPDADAIPDLNFPVPANGGQVVLGDLNGDGNLDAVTSDFEPGAPAHTDYVYVFQQTSIATWIGLDGNPASANSPGLPVNAIYNPDQKFFVPQVAIGDINGDGLPDITIVEDSYTSAPGQTLTYFNLGPSSFASGATIAGFNDGTTGGQPNFLFTVLGSDAVPNSIALGDLSNNGQLDVVLGQGTSGLFSSSYSSIYPTGAFSNYYPTGVQPIPGVWQLTNTSQSVVSAVPVAASPGGVYPVVFDNLQSGQINGSAYADVNGNGADDAFEGGVGGVLVYLDLNGDGILEPGEPSTRTNAKGEYSFSGLPDGLTGVVRVVTSQPVDPAASGGYPFTIGGSTSTALKADFGLRPTLLNPVADTSIVAGEALSAQASLAYDPYLRSGTSGRLVFSLDPGAPSGLTIDPLTGVVSWAADATHPPGVYPVTVRVRDNTDPLRTQATTFNVVVLPATPIGPLPESPKVIDLLRYGIYTQPTRLVLTFDQAMDSASAEDLANYSLTGPGTLKRTIPILSATYDPVAHTVTLLLGHRIDVHNRYHLTVDGSTPNGLTDVAGVPLASAAGLPGVNFQATVIGFHPRVTLPTPKLHRSAHPAGPASRFVLASSNHPSTLPSSHQPAARPGRTGGSPSHAGSKIAR